ncbi:MAG: 16S rRNA (cytosine(1402)-N(4))-methyltransferase RsmH [Mariprofundaceae bacterium]|nr:16S rRNA (cytosine(1402)-N(4))-methyltransferase RsmH [Mariprofundaceae bacterium]
MQNNDDSKTKYTHIPVLAAPFIDGWLTDPDGCYVDATFGRGGHSRMLLSKLSEKGRLLGLDRDYQAVKEGQRLEKEDARFTMCHTDFAGMEHVLADIGWSKVQGIGFDLGVSSPQIDQAERGFSFQKEGPLDMRMNPDEGQTVSERLKSVSERDLVKILRDFGDERFAGRIARGILKAVHAGDMETTKQLENICFHATPPKARHGSTHPATRTFQALRIWVNDEYGQIETAVRCAMKHLEVDGHLSVISFHSGEDRRIRDFIEAEVHPCKCPREFPICVCHKTPTMAWVQKKPIRATEDELDGNARSRSAMLRIAKRVA